LDARQPRPAVAPQVLTLSRLRPWALILDECKSVVAVTRDPTLPRRPLPMAGMRAGRLAARLPHSPLKAEPLLAVNL